MLMDLFHSTLPRQFAGKEGKYGSTRIHFHSFMLDVLGRQHQVKAKYESMGLGSKDAMPEVARSLAAEGRVLCFDEFQVSLVGWGVGGVVGGSCSWVGQVDQGVCREIGDGLTDTMDEALVLDGELRIAVEGKCLWSCLAKERFQFITQTCKS